MKFSSLAQFRKYVGKIHQIAAKGGKTYAWRGVVDASWGLHSALYRHVIASTGKPPANEAEYRSVEQKVVDEFRRWGLNNRERGRMSALDQLAAMQHYGAPTRLLDISFNVYIGLWFAVEEKLQPASNGKNFDEVDGRVFAFDVTQRLIKPRTERSSWESSEEVPWTALSGHELDLWSVQPCAWAPAAFERRIAAQQGGFLYGGVPIYETKHGKTNRRKTAAGTTKYQWPKDTSGTAKWDRSSVAMSTCLHIRPHKFGAKRGRSPEMPCYTFRVAAKAKKVIRDELRALFGYEHRTLFPDYPGFASFAELQWRRP